VGFEPIISSKTLALDRTVNAIVQVTVCVQYSLVVRVYGRSILLKNLEVQVFGVFVRFQVQLPTANCQVQLPTANCQLELPTANCQVELPTANC